jgi:Carboxypeptidase regulatory-like domain
MKMFIFAKFPVVTFLCAIALAGQTSNHGMIIGRVIERETLRPLAAEIGIAGRNNRNLFLRHARTSEDGVFEITDLPAGDLHLTTKLDGYAPEHLSISLDAGETRNVEFYLSKGKIVRGIIYDQTQKPLADARVSVNYAMEAAGISPITATYQWEKRDVVTDNLGRFEVKNIHPEREFIIEASHPNFLNAASAPMIFGLQDKELSINLSIDRGIGVVGVVRDPSGNVIEGVRVGLFDAVKSDLSRFMLSVRLNESSKNALSSSNGEFNFNQVRQVKKILVVSHPGYQPFRKIIDLTGQQSQFSIEVELRSRH